MHVAYYMGKSPAYEIGYCHTNPEQTLKLYHVITKSVVPFTPISHLWGISLSASRQRQLFSSKTARKKEKAKYERRDVAESVWRADSSSIVSGSMWTLIFTALFPSVILSYEVDTKKLNGLARARVEVSETLHSASISSG